MPFWGLSANAVAVPFPDVQSNAAFKKRIIEEVVVDACKMPNVLLQDWKAQHIHKLHKADSKRRGLVLLQTVFHGPLDLLTAKLEECINAEFLSVFMDNFPCGPPSPPPLQHLLSAPSPHLKASLQTVFECQVQHLGWKERLA